MVTSLPSLKLNIIICDDKPLTASTNTCPGLLDLTLFSAVSKIHFIQKE